MARTGQVLAMASSPLGPSPLTSQEAVTRVWAVSVATALVARRGMAGALQQILEIALGVRYP